MRRGCVLGWMTLLLWATSCGGSGSADPRLIATWVQALSESTYALTFNPDGTYEAETLMPPPTTSADAEVVMGVYSASGNQITETPQESTCPSPVPVETISYSFSGADLVIVVPGKIVTSTGLVRDTGSITGNASLVYGCFTFGTPFMQGPLAPVSN